MSKPFSDAIITTAGAALLARVEAGQAAMEITRVVVGEGIYTPEEREPGSLKDRTALKIQRGSFTPSHVDIVSEDSIRIRALVSNVDPVTGDPLVTIGYFFNELGVYAKERDGASTTECLYCIAITSGDTGDYMPPYEGGGAAQIIQDVYLTVGNAATTYVDIAGAAFLAIDGQQLKTDFAGLIGEFADLNDDMAAFKTHIETVVGAPLVAQAAAEMTDTTRVYVYVGSETGYTSGNWYYYDGTSWVSGGVYNATAVNTDKTLTQEDQPADAKKTGDEITDLKQDLSENVTELKNALQDKADIKNSTETQVDLDISDENGNVILRLANGHIETKEFDSSKLDEELSRKQDALIFDNTPTENSANPVTSGGVYDALQGAGSEIIYDSEETEPDLDISDNYGNVVVRFSGGGIKTKQFDGSKYTTFSVDGRYTVGQSKTSVIDRAFKKGDRIVLHIAYDSPPWTSGGRVAYYAGNIQITEATWRGAETYLEYIVPSDVDNISAVLPTNAFNENISFSFEVSLLGDIAITPTIVTIKKDGSGNYTNLKTCLADIGWKANDVLNPYRIEIYPGTYDVLEGYTQEEIENIYYGEISVNQYSQTSFVGPKLLNGMSLIGMGKPEDVVLTAWLDPEPTDDLSKRQRGQISTINLQGSGSIENLTIIAQNMRYCVHDDFSAPLGKKCKRVVKNCIFRGYNIAYGPHTTYGAGMPQGGMDFLFVGCDFGEDVGVHTQTLLYKRPEIHLVNCKGHSFRIGDNETVSPVEEYTVYHFDNCDFLDIRQSMGDTVPHTKVRGTGGTHPFYQLDPQVEYNTGEITIVPSDVLGTVLTVGTCVEMYNDNSSGVRFRSVTALDNFAGVIVYIDDNDNTYIQTSGYVRTDRLGLDNFALHDYIGISGTACAVVSSASDAFGKIVYVDYYGEGYVKIGGRF